MANLRLIAKVTDGQVHGDGAFEVSTLSSLETAAGNSLAFYVGGAPATQLQNTAAGAVLLQRQHAELFDRHKIIVHNPYLAYARASVLFARSANHAPDKIHPRALIAASASIHADAVIGAYSVIGAHCTIAQGVVIGSHASVGDGCVLGRDTALAPGVRIHARSRIGARCNLAEGAVVGCNGFGYAENHGEWVRIEQLGGVIIGDDVDIGANTTIARGALDNTVLGDGVKLDNHIQIAHNVQVGDHTIMAGCVAIAGSAVIGKRCRLGGRAAILGHLEIADDVHVNANSFIAKSIPQAGVYSSMIPARPAAQWRKTVANLHRLERLAKQIQTFANQHRYDRGAALGDRK